MKLGLLLVLFVFTCECKVFTRCKLAQAIVKTKINKTFLGNWVCLVEKVRKRDTSFITEKTGKKYYGLYQIPQQWCKEKKPGGKCNIACESLLDDDIRDDTQCANFIEQHEGFKFWKKWITGCKDDKNFLIFITQEIYKCPPNLKLFRSSPERRALKIHRKRKVTKLRFYYGSKRPFYNFSRSILISSLRNV